MGSPHFEQPSLARMCFSEFRTISVEPSFGVVAKCGLCGMVMKLLAGNSGADCKIGRRSRASAHTVPVGQLKKSSITGDESRPMKDLFLRECVQGHPLIYLLFVSQACVAQLECRQKNLFVPLKAHVHLPSGDGCSMQLHLRCPSANNISDEQGRVARSQRMRLKNAMNVRFLVSQYQI